MAISLAPGQILTLAAGRHPDPIILGDLQGTKSQPITIRGPDTVMGPGTSFSAYRQEANRLSAMHEDGGSYPGLYFMADNAAMIVRNCQWVVIEDLKFDGCWPTAIYIDNCQHITIRGVSIRGGTIAIGAAGPHTRHLLIEGCDWIQDVDSNGENDLLLIRETGKADPTPEIKNSRLFKKTNWLDVHDWVNSTGRRVDVRRDSRAFDGDFFRAWTIAGYVVIRDNVILDAFNGVHFFNQASNSTIKKYSRNVLIEDNWFVRLRDNAVEAEQFAWHWTVRRNKFVDCYAPFAFEVERSGYFYIYGNLGWAFHRPGPKSDDRTTGRLFKLPTSHQADGPHYVIHNSWLIRSAVAKKKRFCGFHHCNNAIDYYREGEEFNEAAASPFGKGWKKPLHVHALWSGIKKVEKKRFTKRWADLRIEFNGDVIHHPDFPGKLKEAGYPLGSKVSGRDPRFRDRVLGLPAGLKTRRKLPAIDVTLEYPNKATETVIGKNHRAGAWQANDLFSLPGPSFWDDWPGQE